MLQDKDDLEHALNHQREILKEIRARLHKLELREAQQGYNTPPEILTEIERLRERIQQHQKEIVRLQLKGATVSKPPNINQQNNNEDSSPPTTAVETTAVEKTYLNKLIFCIASIDNILGRLSIIKQIIYDGLPGDVQDPKIAVTSAEMYEVDMLGLELLTKILPADSSQVRNWYVNHPIYTLRSTEGQIMTYQEKKIVLTNILNAIKSSK